MWLKIQLTQNAHDVLPFSDLSGQRLVSTRKRYFLLCHDLHRTVMHHVNDLVEPLHTLVGYHVDEEATQP